MIRSIASLLSCLFIISSCYYLCFWGRFNIDIFQYIAIEDMIKGVLYSISSAIAWAFVILLIVGFSLMFELVDFDSKTPKEYSPKIEANFLRHVIKVVFWIILPLGIIAYHEVDKSNRDNEYFTGDLFYKILYVIPLLSLILSISSYRLIIVYINNIDNMPIKSEKRNLLTTLLELTKKIFVIKPKVDSSYIYTSLLEYLTIGLFVYLLTSAVTLGILNSEKIIKGVEYNYVTEISPSLIPGSYKGKVIYLGTISSRVLLADTLIRSYFVVDKDSVPSLHIHHVNIITK